MNVNKVMALARKHLGEGTMESSARFCMEESVKAYDDGLLDRAEYWATRSLEYSVGVFHPDYKKVRHGR
jgi:hypothetical protein